MSQVRAAIIINGKVQGVYFRLATEEEAERLNLLGWVRNRADGAVEAEFEGEEQAVQAMIAWCREGPPEARVTEVAVRWDTPTGYKEFKVVG